MESPNKFTTWNDTEEFVNKNYNSISSSNGSFDILRNTTNDGFNSDGTLVKIGSFNGKMAQVKERLMVFTRNTDVMVSDYLFNGETTYQAVKIVQNEEDGMLIIDVVKK